MLQQTLARPPFLGNGSVCGGKLYMSSTLSPGFPRTLLHNGGIFSRTPIIRGTSGVPYDIVGGFDHKDERPDARIAALRRQGAIGDGQSHCQADISINSTYKPLLPPMIMTWYLGNSTGSAMYHSAPSEMAFP